MARIPFWSSWDDRQKETAVRITGLCIAAFAVFTLLSSLSYLFTWKADQSLVTDPDMMSVDVVSHNAAGKTGFSMGRFMIERCFGLGSFAFLVILAAISARLLLQRWHYSLLRTTVVALSGAFVVSLLLSYFGRMFGLSNAFGGGLGGQCGAFVTDWSINLFGWIITLFFVAVTAICWLFFSSERFSDWVTALVGREKDTDDEETEDAVSEDRVPEPVVGAEPVRQAVPEVRPEPVMTPLVTVTAAPVSEPKTGSVPQPQPKPQPAAALEAPKEMEVIRDDSLSATPSKPLPPIDVRAELPGYKMLDINLLESHFSGKQEVSSEELTRNNNKIRATLANYKIQLDDVKAVVGPTVTLYKVYPSAGVQISQIKRLQDDIAMSLNAKGVRVITLNDSVGIEVANDKASIVPLKALLNDNAFRESKAELPVAIGYTITQKVKVFDLADTPHLLIAGATKQGKSVGLNVLVASLLYSRHPSELKMVFIDPKMVEFSSYAQLLKHYLAVLPTAGDEAEERNEAIVKKAPDAEKILRSLCIEMDERYELLSKALVNNVKLYNEKYKARHLLPTEGHRFMPYLVTIIDEYADLTMSVGGSAESKAAAKSIQTSIIRLAQKGRAAGIHVVLATQRPSVDVISGIIKANFPTRIAFRVTSRIDSMTILDMPGAEKLIGRGDMLFYSGVETERVQCGYISNDEINGITAYIGAQQGYKKSYNTPYYLPDPSPADAEGGGMIDMKDIDERFEEAAKQVVITQKGSTSDLQRRLGMGYAKAGRVMDQLEAAGIVGPQEGSKPRQVLVQDLDSLEQILKAFRK
ncbi:MAG: DNA translocase FtsK 4TM domain-containing protein [Bacteroidales bacterium]|nr:DNA translocase FtsK 4TM domain-containing protein [Candidatus Cryptobacteroides onthequi]